MKAKAISRAIVIADAKVIMKTATNPTAKAIANL